MKTSENLLHAAIGVLEQRGRCRENFELADGSVDPLGALALAAGLEPDTWMGLREVPESQIAGIDRVLVDAAWVLASAAVPGLGAEHMPVHDLVGVVGDWADRSSDAEIFDALTKAAHAAAQACEAVSRG